MNRLVIAFVSVIVCTASLSAEVQKKTVRYEDAGVQLQGYLVWDDAIKGKRPGVLVVHEWWGLNDYARSRAEQLAKLGYVAFALDMYGKGKVTKHPKQAGEWASQIRANAKKWNQRARAGLEILKKHELVDSKRLAAIGYCFGGSTVLQMAFNGTDLAGVVSFHGSLPVPTKEQVQQTKAKILVCHGAADKFIPDDTIQKFRDALEAGKVDWQMICYGGAVHSFTNPNADKYGVEGVKYHAKADRRSWKDMQQFFNEIFNK